jgi:outer membrane biogenesis lipoprotein LolB
VALLDFRRATRSCASVRTLTAELALSGRAGRERLRGRVVVGLAEGGRARLEGLAPFGAPLFVLTAQSDIAALVLPRERRILESAAMRDVLERLTGLPLSADELRLALLGCLGADAGATGLEWPRQWRAVETREGHRVWMARRDGVWRVVSVDAGGWRVDYADWLNDVPRRVRVQTDDATVDLRVDLRQLSLNVALAPETFEVIRPADAVPVRLDELTSVAPLRTP